MNQLGRSTVAVLLGLTVFVAFGSMGYKCSSEIVPGAGRNTSADSATDVNGSDYIDAINSNDSETGIIVKDGASDGTGGSATVLDGSKDAAYETGGSTTDSGSTPSLANCQIFPSDNPWNTDVSKFAIHSNSDNFINSIGRTRTMHPDFGTVWEGAPIGIPFVIVGGSQQKVPIQFIAYGSQSDPGPYPIPINAPIEGGPNGVGDRHVIAIETGTCKLYELYNAYSVGSGWKADSGAIWDLKINGARKLGWTSADAAGLPIFPSLVRYDEVKKGIISHALRFTVRYSQMAYILPASHYASKSTNSDYPPMGLRLRMKSSYNCTNLSSEVQIICVALKRYGMIVADNGTDWYLSGSPDARWNDDHLRDLGKIVGDAFEVVNTGSIKTY